MMDCARDRTGKEGRGNDGDGSDDQKEDRQNTQPDEHHLTDFIQRPELFQTDKNLSRLEEGWISVKRIAFFRFAGLPVDDLFEDRITGPDITPAVVKTPEADPRPSRLHRQSRDMSQMRAQWFTNRITQLRDQRFLIGGSDDVA